MSFISKVSKGIKGATQALQSDEYEINGSKIQCVYCGNHHFEFGEAQLNTAGLTFLNLEWANESASILACKNCSHIMWFAKSAKKVI